MTRQFKSDYEQLCHDWSIEFSEMLQIRPNPIFDEIIKLTASTMLYRIADEFEDGKYRQQILDWFSEEKNEIRDSRCSWL